MTAIEGWIPATPTSPSFRDLFKVQVDVPQDNSLSYSNKDTTFQEENDSGPSLRRLAKLDINTLHLSLPTHDLTWAGNLLAQYAPVQPIGWHHRSIEAATPDMINSETNTLSFVECAYLRRALCAGWFLYCHSVGHPSSPCPVRNVLRWHDTSSNSLSGRPDRTLFYNTMQAVLVEGKTAKVSRSVDDVTGPANVLHKLADYAENFHRNDQGPSVSTWLRQERTWEIKGRQFLLQVCNDMHINKLFFLLNHPPGLAPASLETCFACHTHNTRTFRTMHPT